MRDINQAGLDLIKRFEGIPDGDPSTTNLDPYLDPIGIWTIGWGHAIRVGNDFLRGAANRAKARALYPGGITLAQAEKLLHADVLDKCRDVEAMIKVQLTDNQYAALVSFAFNARPGQPAPVYAAAQAQRGRLRGCGRLSSQNGTRPAAKS